MDEMMFGVVPGEEPKDKSFWILCESGGYPVTRAYVCNRCREAAAEPTGVCQNCGAEMSNMVIRSLWVDFNE